MIIVQCSSFFGRYKYDNLFDFLKSNNVEDLPAYPVDEESKNSFVNDRKRYYNNFVDFVKNDWPESSNPFLVVSPTFLYDELVTPRSINISFFVCIQNIDESIRDIGVTNHFIPAS